jgi:hypothetical protein
MGIRYIFHGGARERNPDGSARQVGIAHNGAFMAAARNVQKEYVSSGDSDRMIKIHTASDLVNEINRNSPNQVKSLDILSHGTPYSLNFSVKENENCGLVTGTMAKILLKVYYSSWEDGIYSFSSQSRLVSDINFSVFSLDARLQMHGCNTARGSIPGDTLAESFSRDLYKAGKTLSYVIGHTDKSNPMINGATTSISAQDYRHGKRAVIHNGQMLFETNQKGLLKHSDIINIIKGKL